MRKKLITRYFMAVAVAVIASLLLDAGSVFAQTGTTQGSSTSKGLRRATSVVSPYWQSDSGTYTFIGISHPSLSGMASQIGLVVTAYNLAGASAGSTEFTISTDSTAKLFIAATNNSAINPSNTALSGTNFIITTSNYVAGQLQIAPKAVCPACVAGTNGVTNGARDVTMLTMWGAVVVQSNSSGFAMEFIGDLADSRNPALNTNVAAGVN